MFKLIGCQSCAAEVDTGAYMHPQMLATLFFIEDTLSMFILIRETAAGILTLSMFLLGSISQPHSSFSNTLALIGPHPHLLSLTTSSVVSMWRDTDVPGPAQACRGALAFAFELHMWTAEPCVDTELIQGLLFVFLPCWCLSVPLPTVVWKPGNDVAHQFARGQGYSTLVPEAAWQGLLSPILARTLNISLPGVLWLLKFCLISQRALFYLREACRCIRIADTFNPSSIARRHLMSLWVSPAKHTIKCTMHWETWLQFVWKKSHKRVPQGLICPVWFY